MLQKKVCLLGASAVGKTSLVKRFVDGIFSEKYLTTIGVKIDKKQVELTSETVQFMLWDIEGVDRYCGFNPKYLRGASAYIIVADNTRAQSLIEGMDIHQMAREATDAPALLAINKTDLPEKWHWNVADVAEFSQDFAECFYTSAKTGDQVETMFKFLATLLTR